MKRTILAATLAAVILTGCGGLVNYSKSNHSEPFTLKTYLDDALGHSEQYKIMEQKTQACFNGNKATCAELKKSYDRIEKEIKASPIRHVTILTTEGNEEVSRCFQECANGNGYSCYRIGWSYYSSGTHFGDPSNVKLPLKVNTPQRMEAISLMLFDKSCHLGYYPGCYQVSENLRNGYTFHEGDSFNAYNKDPSLSLVYKEKYNKLFK